MDLLTQGSVLRLVSSTTVLHHPQPHPQQQQDGVVNNNHNHNGVIDDTLSSSLFRPTVQFIVGDDGSLYISDGVWMVEGLVSFISGVSFTIIDHSICRLRDYQIVLEQQHEQQQQQQQQHEQPNNNNNYEGTRLVVIINDLEIIQEPHIGGLIGQPQILQHPPNLNQNRTTRRGNTHQYQYHHHSSQNTKTVTLDLGTFHHVHSKPRKQTKKQELTWRMDPTESLSDWTIQVINEDEQQLQLQQQQNDENSHNSNNNNIDTYHVHRAYLGAGKRSSGYFTRLFRSAVQMQESSTSISRIVLQPSATKAFPAMLDFIYTGQMTTTTTTLLTHQNCVALRYLANYFEIEELFDEVNKFIRSEGLLVSSNNKSISSAPVLLSEALLYQDEKILKAATDASAANFHLLDYRSLLKLPIKLMTDLVTSPKLSSSSYSSNADTTSHHHNYLSQILAKYCVAHEHEMTGEQLARLTKTINIIDETSALTFLKLAIENPPIGDAHDNISTRSITGDGGDLRNKSIQATASFWETSLIPVLNRYKDNQQRQQNSNNNHSINTISNQTEIYHSIPSKDKVETLEEALRAAHHDMNEMRTIIDNLNTEGKTQQEQIATLEGQVKRTEIEVNKAHAELRKFHRVPLDHDFETRYYCQNKNKNNSDPKQSTKNNNNITRQESRGYIGVGMERFPTATPSLGLFQPHPNLGYIYDDGNNPTKYWPVFYYKSEPRGRFSSRR